MGSTRLTHLTDPLILLGLGCLVVTALDPRHRFLLDLLIHARRDKAHGWGN
jgi:hypothetical protein